MIEILNNSKSGKIVQMKDMKHGQVGVITDNMYKGEVVIRLDDNCYSLSRFEQGKQWSDCTRNPLTVRLFGPGEYIDVRISND